MKKNIILISLPFLMAALWFLIFTWLFRSVPWNPLGLPPQPARNIVNYDYDFVTVQTSDDTAYRCDIARTGFDNRDNQNKCLEWVKITLPSNRVAEPTAQVSECRNLIPPGKMVDCVSSTGGFEINYIILTDGSVWDYSYFVGDLDIGGYMEFYLTWVGTGVVFLISAIISMGIFIWSRRRAALRG